MGLQPSELADVLHGPVAFSVTPFRRGRVMPIDWPSFRDHVDRLAGSGLSALVVGAGMGEFSALAPAEINALCRGAMDVVRGRVPVIGSVGLGTGIGRRLAAALGGAGIDGLLVLPPAYATPDGEGLVRYYRVLAQAAPRTGFAVYCRDHVPLSVELLERLAPIENVVAIKEGHGNVRELVRVRAALGDRFRLLGGAGDDLVAPYAAAGVDGVTSSIACFDPPVALEAWRLVEAGEDAALEALVSERVVPWFELRRRRAGYEVAVTKGAVEAFGGRAGPVRPPLANLTEEDRADVDALAARLGPFRP
jgi:5-dehydro-4-deoxyglucarate dehydratase